MVESINKEYKELKENRTNFDYEDHIWSLKRGQKLNYFYQILFEFFVFNNYFNFILLEAKYIFRTYLI